MRVSTITAYGTLSSVYYCDKGEGLPWHGHGPDSTHGHKVIVGSTVCEIEGDKDIITTADAQNFELPVGKRHQITALENGTIFVNIASYAPAEIDPNIPKVPHVNRVLMADGTIVEA
jgi:hypothetical protein